jgi:hypothetical protein
VIHEWWVGKIDEREIKKKWRSKYKKKGENINKSFKDAFYKDHRELSSN